MQTPPENIDVILPYGEILRSFMEQSFITKADLKSTLRARGVFVGPSEKRDTIPILISSLISPREFDQLRERQDTREDNPKTNTRFLAWNSEKPLLECLPDSLDVNALIKDTAVNYAVVGTPTFVPVGKGGNCVRMDVEIERRDLSKSWCLSNTKFKASIELQRVVEGKTAKLLLTHTAQETKDLTQLVTKQLTNHFRSSNFMPATGGIIRILFSDFTNAERARFFWTLTADINDDWFQFEQIIDFDISPAAGESFPPELKWLGANIKELKFKGTELQDNLFLKNSAFHSKLLFFRMEAKYKFEFYGGKGDCAVSFEFSDFDSDDSTECEFEINISQLSMSPQYAHVNKLNVKEQLLRQIETFTQKQYDTLKNQRGLSEDAQTSQPIAIMAVGANPPA